MRRGYTNPEAVGSCHVPWVKENRNKEEFLWSVSSCTPLFLTDHQVAALSWLTDKENPGRKLLMALKGITEPLWIFRGLKGAVEKHFGVFWNPLQFHLTQVFILGWCLSPTNPVPSPIPSHVPLSLSSRSETKNCWSFNTAGDQPAAPVPLPCSDGQDDTWCWEGQSCLLDYGRGYQGSSSIWDIETGATVGAEDGCARRLGHWKVQHCKFLHNTLPNASSSCWGLSRGTASSPRVHARCLSKQCPKDCLLAGPIPNHGTGNRGL